MPKMYPESASKEQHERDSKNRKAVGVYDRPEKTAASKEIIIAVAVIIALLLLFLFYRLVQGDSSLSETARGMRHSQYHHHPDGVRLYSVVALR